MRRYYKGGRLSRQIGHCKRYRIQPSRHGVWKICRHGVTIYARRLNSVVDKAVVAALAAAAAAAVVVFVVEVVEVGMRDDEGVRVVLVG